MATLRAISDLHIAHRDNREVVEQLRPEDPGDWLIVAGDVAETVADVRWALELLASRFEKVVWVPGNHELWTHPADEVTLRGVARYEHLVEICRELGVAHPEGDWPVWHGEDGPLRIAPLFVLYDYSFRAPGTRSTQESLAYAHSTGVVCADEYLLHPDPYPTREAWCRARVAATRARLDACPPDPPLLLVNHWPLDRRPTDVLWRPEFAQWCGTDLTADWHIRYPVAGVVYGHLHIPRRTVYDGVPFQEVSLGYPREWGRRGLPDVPARPVSVAPVRAAARRLP